MKLALIACAAWLCFVTPAQAGYSAWIAANPELAFPGREAWTVDLALLRRVNSEINAAMTYRAERVDRWEHGSDCEDYAIAKLRLLLTAGVPRGAMRLTIVMIDGKGHVFLVVGERWVMTNGRDDVFRLDRSALMLWAWER